MRETWRQRRKEKCQDQIDSHNSSSSIRHADLA
jgi:hypothetical protein